MHSMSDNIEVMTYATAHEVIEEIFGSLLSIYEIGLETSLKDSEWLFFIVLINFIKNVIKIF